MSAAGTAGGKRSKGGPQLRAACRICLKPASLHLNDVVSVCGSAFSIGKLLLMYSKVQYSEPWMPRRLCGACARHLQRARRFHLDSARAHATLGRLYRSAHPVLDLRHLQGRDQNQIHILPKETFQIYNTKDESSPTSNAALVAAAWSHELSERNANSDSSQHTRSTHSAQNIYIGRKNVTDKDDVNNVDKVDKESITFNLFSDENKKETAKLSLDETVNMFEFNDLQDKSYVLKVGDVLDEDLRNGNVNSLIKSEQNQLTQKVNEHFNVNNKMYNTDELLIHESTPNKISKEAISANEVLIKDSTIIEELIMRDSFAKEVFLQNVKTNKKQEFLANEEFETTAASEDKQDMSNDKEIIIEVAAGPAPAVNYYVVGDDERRHLVQISAQQAEMLVNGQSPLLTTERHQRKEKPRRPGALECAACGLRVTRRYNLLRHLAAAHAQRVLTCRACRASFASPTAYDAHRLRECPQRLALAVKNKQAKGTRRRAPRCPVCEERFAGRPAVVEHMRRAHAERVAVRAGSLLCTACNKTFVSWGGLEYHMRTHSGTASRYRCAQCGLALTSGAALASHAASKHAAPKPHLCALCGRGLSGPDHLRKHMQLTHERRRDHLCGVCGQAFQQASHLANHQWVHTGVKPHTCQYCGATFTTKSTLKKHQKRQHSAAESQIIQDIP